MKLAAITRIRNEAEIIQGALDHVAGFVDGIYVYDDVSEDATVDICQAHPAVMEVIQNPGPWNGDPKFRAKAEGIMRTQALSAAVRDGATHIYCFDPDERLQLTRELEEECGMYYFNLFDFYITEEDKDKHYLERRWMGPEYRIIPMIFKVNPNLKFTQRVPRGMQAPMKFGGYVRHYGTAISVERWEEKCDYYINVRFQDRQPALRQLWKNRRGRAVHTDTSDFGKPLITWEDKADPKKTFMYCDYRDYKPVYGK